MLFFFFYIANHSWEVLAVFDGHFMLIFFLNLIRKLIYCKSKYFLLQINGLELKNNFINIRRVINKYFISKKIKSQQIKVEKSKRCV